MSTLYALTCQTAGLAEPDMEGDDAHEVPEAEEEVDIDNEEETEATRMTPTQRILEAVVACRGE